MGEVLGNGEAHFLGIAHTTIESELALFVRYRHFSTEWDHKNTLSIKHGLWMLETE